MDNSRDWEAVKVARPPPEELVGGEPETTPTAADDDILEIFKELEPDDTARESESTEDEELMSILMDRRRRRRKRSPSRERPRGGFGQEPPVYGRTRLDMGPHLPRYPPPRPQRPQPIDYNAWTGNDYGGVAPVDYPLGGYVDEEPLTPPPKKVVEAVKTLENFMAGKDVGDEDEESDGASEDKNTNTTTVQMTTSTTSTTTTATTTTATTTTRSPTTQTTTETPTSLETTTFARHKKPTGSFDNDTGLSAGDVEWVDSAKEKDVTILNVLNEYGVSSHENVGFVIDAVYSFALSFVLCFCLCYNPREPRSSSSPSSSGEQKSSEESRIFKCSFTFLLFFLAFVHWSMFVSYQYTLPKVGRRVQNTSPGKGHPG